MMMNYRRQFEKFLLQNAPFLGGETENLKGIHNYIQKIYFEDPKGCIPDEYIGEDLMNDIQSKFYFPLAFLRLLFFSKHAAFRNETLIITIDPSYESPTNYNLILYERRIVLLQDNWAAWKFWFDNDDAFDNWINTCLTEMDEGLKMHKL
jgi:hypothetical protein